MKKALLLSFALVISVMVFGQQQIKFRDGLIEHSVPHRIYTDQSGNAPIPTLEPSQTKGENSSIQLRMMGTSGNAFGFLGVRQYIWADDAINGISFVHRLNNPPNGPGSGYLGYDYSVDGGATWTNNVQVYDAPNATFNARYPQGAFYNPAGNTDPSNAYFGYFAAVLDGSNGGTWGGYGYGAHRFGSTDDPTQTNVAAVLPDFPQGVPEAYTITSQGLAICADPSNNGVALPYADFFIITKGYFNEEIGDFEMDRYTEFMPAGGISPTGTLAGVADSKIAFSPDGSVGYLVFLSNNGLNSVESDGCYHPILYKTTDGGDFWDGPYNVQLGGVDGLPVVLDYLRDELIEILFEPPLPDRVDIPFTTSFEIGISVDYNGNPHLIFSVGVGSTEFSIYTSHAGAVGCDGMVAMLHVFSQNGGEDWLGNMLTLPKTFRGEFPYSGGDPVAEDNRPFVASTHDGTKLFFSWIDTDVPDVGDNLQPDIYCIGYDVINNTYSNTYVVTQFSAAWFSSFMAAGSKYALDLGNGSYKVPFVYQQIDPQDLINPVQYWFVDNFILTDADLGVIQGQDEMAAFNFSVSQNYPNPARDFAYVDVMTEKSATINVSVSNLIGQTVWQGEAQKVGAGKHQIKLNTSGLKNGVYLYNIQVDSKIISKKLIIN